MSQQQGPNPYLKTKIMTASPEELRLMLYDGAIKFCHQAKLSIEKKDYEGSYNNLMRAQKIVLELSTSLNHSVDTDLCKRMEGLYTYIYRKLIDASMTRQTEAVGEAIKLLEFERETWQMLMKKLATEGLCHNPEAKDGPINNAQQTAISSLSKSA